MTSGPYQSNVLRFFVRQYWQGLARHKKAVRQTRYAVASTARVGVAVSVQVAQVAIAKPIQGMIAAVRTAGEQVKRLASRVRGKETLLSGVSEEAVKLFDFSDFACLPEAEGSAEAGAALAKFEDDSVVVRSGSAELVAEELVAERVMVRSLITIASCLVPEQVKALANTQAGEASITGVASDLKTRSLVLIQNYRMVWNGLSAEQQQHLQQKIAAFLRALWPGDTPAVGVVGGASSEFALPSVMELTVAERRRDLSGAEQSRGLSVPTVSFWVEVLRVVAWLKRRMASVRRLPGRRLQLAGERSQLPGHLGLPEQRLQPAGRRLRLPMRFLTLPAGMLRLPTGGLAVARLEGEKASGGAMLLRRGFDLVRRFSADGVAKQTVNDGDRDYIEASVVGSVYVMHPLERALNWVDRCLLWLENGWRRLRAWLSGLD